MKTLLILIAALGLTACQTKSNPSPVTPTAPDSTVDNFAMTAQKAAVAQATASSVTLMDDTLKGCYAKIDELKHFDRKRANALSTALSKTVKAETDTRASAEHISAQALSYAMYHHQQNVELICTQVSQKLDKLILASVMKNSA